MEMTKDIIGSEIYKIITKTITRILVADQSWVRVKNSDLLI